MSSSALRPGSSQIKATPTFDHVTFTACTGATVAPQAFAPLPAEFGKDKSSDGQLADAGPLGTYDVISMTFGGNDLGFPSVITTCLTNAFGSYLSAWQAAGLPGLSLIDALPGFCGLDSPSKRRDIADLQSQLANLYELAAAYLRPGGHFYVLGYPHLFAPSTTWGKSGMCSGIKAADADAISGLIDTLNAAVSQTVVALDNKNTGGKPTATSRRISFFPIDTIYGKGNEHHELCGDKPAWINPFPTKDPNEARLPLGILSPSFHPNALGHAAVASLLSARATAELPAYPTEAPPGPAPLPNTQSSPYGPLVFIQGNKVYSVNIDGSQQRAEMAPTSNLADVGFTKDGVLYVSMQTSSEAPSPCDLYRVGQAAPRVRFSDIQDSLGFPGPSNGLCDLVGDPRGGLLSTVGSGGGSSYQVFHLDLGPGTPMAHVEAPGYELASSPDGSELVTVVHRYFQGPGSYETLLMGTPGVQASFRPIVAVPSPSDPFAYAHPAYSPDGQKIAAVLSHSSDAIVVGKPGSELVPLWSAPESRRIGRITWLRSGQGFLAHVYSADSNTVGDLFQISADGATTRMAVQGVSAFALWAQP